MCKSYRLHVYFIVTNYLRRQRCNNTTRYPNLCKVCSDLMDQIPPQQKSVFPRSFQVFLSVFLRLMLGCWWADDRNALIYSALSNTMTWAVAFFPTNLECSVAFFGTNLSRSLCHSLADRSRFSSVLVEIPTQSDPVSLERMAFRPLPY